MFSHPPLSVSSTCSTCVVFTDDSFELVEFSPPPKPFTLLWKEFHSRFPTLAFQGLCEFARVHPEETPAVAELANLLVSRTKGRLAHILFGHSCVEFNMVNSAHISSAKLKACVADSDLQAKSTHDWRVLRLVDHGSLQSALESLVQPEARLQVDEACLAATGLTVW